MKNTLKILALLVAACMILCVLCSCGGGDNKETEAETKQQETQPGETEPAETQPGETEPAETEPEETEPGETEPGETEPGETEPAETEPEETGDPAIIPNTEDAGKGEWTEPIQ